MPSVPMPPYGPGAALRRMRRLRNIKQAHLAELVGVSQATISRWESGTLDMSPSQRRSLARVLALPPQVDSDHALRRLVETSSLSLHLICDVSHRLLAASPRRQAEWRRDPADYLGTTLIVYASDEILAAESAIADLGWHDGAIGSYRFVTGANADPDFHILPGQVLWERLMLADGSPARLVTTTA